MFRSDKAKLIIVAIVFSVVSLIWPAEDTAPAVPSFEIVTLEK